MRWDHSLCLQHDEKGKWLADKMVFEPVPAEDSKGKCQAQKAE
jgi:hypothetical protein